MLTEYMIKKKQKTEKDSKKRLRKGIFLKKKKTSAILLVNYIEIFLKKRKTTSTNILASNI